jgi:1-acyl-sn-glycerol-3-phosphate acyltransferase
VSGWPRRGDLNGWWRLGVLVVSAFAPLAFKIQVRGIRRVPPSGPGIVAANHVSALDGLVLAYVVGRRRRRMVRFLVAAEFFRKPRVAWALRLYRQIPLRRGEGDDDALGTAISMVRAGALAGIFPEGKVNPAPDDGLQRGRSGVGRIALGAAAPVVPVAIWGTQRRWPKSGLRWTRPWRVPVVVAFGSPIEPDGASSSVEDVQRMTTRVMGALAEMVARTRS